MISRRAFGVTATVNQDGDYEFALSSEQPVERWYGMEILDHREGSVNLERLADGRHPLLLNHNTDEQVGVVRRAWLDTHDRKTRVVTKFSRAAKAQEIKQDVDDDIRTLVSVGYVIDQVTEEKRDHAGNVITRTVAGDIFEREMRQRHGETFDRILSRADRQSEDVPVYRITRWTPFEASIVSIPADVTVGKGRAMDVHVSTTVTTSSTNDTCMQETVSTQADIHQASVPSAIELTDAATRRASMSEEKKETATVAVIESASKISAIEAEKERRGAIQNLCRSNKIDPRVEERWITEGATLPQVAKEILDVMEERGKQKPVAASLLGLSSKDTQKYSIFRAIRALKFGGVKRQFVEEAAFEMDCSNAVAKQLGRDLTSNILIPGEVLTRPLGEAAVRAMATQPGSKGGYLVNVENMGFIDILRNRSVALSMGARNLSGLVGNVTFARQTGKATVTWQGGDGASVTATDQALGQLSMTPKTAIAITDVSEQLLRQSTPSAEQFVMADLAADIAIDGVDNVAINGTGGAQPLGIKNTTGVATGQDAASATYAKVLAFVSTAGAANAIRGNPGFVTNTVGASVLMQKQRFTSTDTPLWEGNMLDGQLVGFRAMSSEQLASGNLIFGSWGEVIIGDWGVLELAMDNGGTRFNQAQVGIRAMWMVDVLIRYPQAFVVSTNLSA